MTVQSAPGLDVALRLGRHHLDYGVVGSEELPGGRTASALCVGASPLALTSGHKVLHGVANEDALLAIESGPRTLLAVADAHFGPEAAEEVLAGLRESAAAAGLPSHPLDLMKRIRRISRSRGAGYASETTLLVAVVDRSVKAGFAVSFGDSSLWAFRPGDTPRVLSRKNDRYVTPCHPASLDPRRATESAFRCGPGDLIVALTDGVDECHYRRPNTSVAPRHVAPLWNSSAGRPKDWVEAVGSQALRGVDGNPGGEDNLAIIATRC